MNLTSAQGDESYTLALAFQKLKVLLDSDSLTVEELKTFQLNMIEDLRKAQQHSENATFSQRTEHHAVAADIQPTVVLTQQKLCDYSSSESGSSSVPISPCKMIQERMFSENPIADIDYDNPNSHNSSFSSSPDNERQGSPSQSYIEEDNLTSPSQANLSMNFSVPDTPASSISICSQHTWLARTPDQSSRHSDRELFLSRKTENCSGSSDSESDESSAPSHFRSDLSMVSETHSLSTTMMSNMYEEENMMNDESFSAVSGGGTHKPLDISIQSKRGIDFFSQSTVIVSQPSTSSNPFHFVNERLPDTHQSFQSMFKNTDTTPKNSLTPFPSSRFKPAGGSEHNRNGNAETELSSPFRACKTPQVSNPLKRSSVQTDSPSSDESKSLCASPAEKRNCLEDKILVKQAPIGGLKSLQIVMDSYCSSDSNSD